MANSKMHVNFVGRLGGDAELRFTEDGDPILNLSVAVGGWGGGAKTTSWVRCSWWGKRAENLGPYLTKGSVVGVTGTLKTNEDGNPNIFFRKDEDGKPTIPDSSFEVNVNDVDLMGGGERKEDAPPKKKKGKKNKKNKPQPKGDIPF